MRAKSVLLLMLALGCGLVASIGITRVMANRESAASAPDGDTQQIFVAMADIPTGDQIKPEMVKLEAWPKDKVPEGALTKNEEVHGHRPKTKIWKGEVILANKLVSDGVVSGAAEEVPVGLRVVSVMVDKESGISDLIRPGDRVDVLLFTKESPGTFVKTTVRTIFQDIKVFAVNDVFNLESTDGQSSINAKTVSLLVTPQQVEKFTLASELGQIRLALRSHEDKEPVELAGVTARDLDEGSVANRDREELKTERPDATGSGELQNFLSMLDKPEVRAPEPAPPKPPDSWTVQLIKADAVEEVVLEEAGESPGANQPGATPSGFNFWRMISPGRSGSFRGSPPKSDAHPRPEKEEEKAGEPQPQDEPQDGPAMPDED